MKKITSILLALTFVLYLGGMQAIYWIKLSVDKQQSRVFIQKNNFSTADIKTFSFTPAEYKILSWSEENKEFSYQGGCYDIIGMKYCSDKIIVNCYVDQDETAIIDAFSGFIKKMFSSPQQKDDNKNDIANKITKEYLPAGFLMPSYFPRTPTPIDAVCVLVNVSQKIEDIWHPPTLA